MLIAAHASPIELLLSLVVRDYDGRVLQRVVSLDTETMEVKQLLLDADGSTRIVPTKASDYWFVAHAPITAQELRELLPEEQHSRIVQTFA